jgi:MFS family permease
VNRIGDERRLRPHGEAICQPENARKDGFSRRFAARIVREWPRSGLAMARCRGNKGRDLFPPTVPDWMASHDVTFPRAEAASGRRSKLRTVVSVASGNFLEMYDFTVFGYFAGAIGQAFFPSGDSFASLMSSMATYAVGYAMRPLGALLLGAYVDRQGRRKGLMLTLGLMAIGILSIALMPGYATIGVWAPMLVVLGRLIQGLSAGVELGGVSVYLAEIATPGHKGFYVSWQSGSQQVAVMVAASLGVLLSSALGPDKLNAWGWRLPLLFGCAIVPVLLVLRSSMQETEAFLAQPRRPALDEVVGSIVANAGIVAIGLMMVLMTTVSFYLITAYTPTFATRELHLASVDSMLVTLCVGASNLFWLPVMGALSDRVGRRPLLVACTVLALATSYPAMSWLVAAPSFARLLIVELWLSFLYASYNGAMIVFLTEIMPSRVRTTGFSLAYSLATTVGGSSLLISTSLIKATGDRAAPALLLSAAAACGLLAAIVARPHQDGTVHPPR